MLPIGQWTCFAAVVSTVFLMRDGASPDRSQGNAEPPAQSSAPIKAPGLQNVFRITDKLYTGSNPEGDAGFASLQRLGVRTIITVDGASPEVDRARKWGMRYVHLPVGYDGISQEQAWKLAKAVRDLPGPIYLHCHHGKHRAPTAAALVHRCLDEQCTIEAALAELHRAGTDPHYRGLYASVRKVRVPRSGELDQVTAEYPEKSRVPDLVERMVQIDDYLEHLKSLRTANWKPVPEHPDLAPAHEALQLLEQFREAGRADDVRSRPKDFSQQLESAIEAAADLEASLRTAPKAAGGRQAIEASYQRVANACKACHAQYRDEPRPTTGSAQERGPKGR